MQSLQPRVGFATCRWARVFGCSRECRGGKRAALVLTFIILGSGLAAAPASAGPVIIGGDDLTLHGSYSAGANHKGWLYIQKALDRMFQSGCITRANDGTIAALGVTDSSVTGGGDAGAAIHFGAGALPKVVNYFEGAPAINAFLAGVGSGANNPAVIWIASNFDISNDLDNAETDALVANATILRDFVNQGGGLMAHTEGLYHPPNSSAFTGNPWLGVVIPGLQEVGGCQSAGAALTAAATLDFPGLTSSDINSIAGPCHTNFTGIGTLDVLATDGHTPARNFIIGGGCATTIHPLPDHFTCYTVQQTKHQCNVAPPTIIPCIDNTMCPPGVPCLGFPLTGIPVNLEDQFEACSFRVRAPISLCAPTNKNNEGLVDPDTHLKVYRLTTNLPHAPHAALIQNQFGKVMVQTIRATRLLVPTAKSATGLVDPPDPTQHNVDHYKCYRVQVLKNVCQGNAAIPCTSNANCGAFGPCIGGFVGTTINIVNQFESATVGIKNVLELCTPVDKNGEGIKNPAVHLLCYDAHKILHPLGPYYVNNQFGPERLTVKARERFCVPSSKTLVPLKHCGNGKLNAGEQCDGPVHTCSQPGRTCNELCQCAEPISVRPGPIALTASTSAVLGTAGGAVPLGPIPTSLTLDVNAVNANHEATITIEAAHTSFGSGFTPTAGGLTFCVNQSGDGAARLCCNAAGCPGLGNKSFSVNQDHDSSGNNSGLGFLASDVGPADSMCTATVSNAISTLPANVATACEEREARPGACNADDLASGNPNSHAPRCFGGANNGQFCDPAGSLLTECPGGTFCASQSPALPGTALPSSPCNGPATAVAAAAPFANGDLVLSLPLQITVHRHSNDSIDYGPSCANVAGDGKPDGFGCDGIACTADDTTLPNHPVNVVWTTGTTSATVFDANLVPTASGGSLTTGALAGVVPANACSNLAAGNTTGYTLVGAFPALDDASLGDAATAVTQTW